MSTINTINAEGAFLKEARDKINTNFANLNTDKIQWSAVPATAGAAGTAGQVAYESGYLYVCVATNTWLRVAIVTWP